MVEYVNENSFPRTMDEEIIYIILTGIVLLLLALTFILSNVLIFR